MPTTIIDDMTGKQIDAMIAKQRTEKDRTVSATDEYVEEMLKVPQINVLYKENSKGQKVTPIEFLPNGDFVDLRCAEDVDLKAGEFAYINLGLCIKLPDGFWGQVVPRSSTFKKYGIIQTNSFGVIDESYCGEEDVWMMPVYAVRDTHIDFDTRLCQFRIVRKQPFTIETVDHLNDESRGGFGSTGEK
jgi:dUTP pyrophosphatase